MPAAMTCRSSPTPALQDFHPFDSNKVLSASLDHSVKIWDLQCECFKEQPLSAASHRPAVPMTYHIGCKSGLLCTECPHQSGGRSPDGVTTAAAAVRKYVEESHNYNDDVAQEAFPTVRLQFPHFTSRKVRNA